MCKWKTFLETLSDAKSMTKKEYLLTMGVCLLGGITLGMLISPRKHTTIGSHNGCNNSYSQEQQEEDILKESK